MWKASSAAVLLLALLPITVLSSNPDTRLPLIEVEVLEVQDGDTFDACILTLPQDLQAALVKENGLERGQCIRVRLLGIDSPEVDHPDVPCECYGEEASEALKRLLPEGTAIWLEPDERLFDDYSRLLAYAYLDPDGTQMVNGMMVASGHAVTSSLVPNIRYEGPLTKLEAGAREGRFGLWGACVFSWEDADAHIGEEAVFTGRVGSTYYDLASRTTFVNLGLPYPDPGRLTIAIPPQVRDLFTYELEALPEAMFRGVVVAVFGKVEREADSLEIRLLGPSRLWVLTVEEQPNVVIWEVEVNPAGEDQGNEWVKLHNLTTEDINIGGWLVMARAGQPGAVEIELETIIPRGGFYVVDHVPFLWLDNEGEYIELRDQEGRLVDCTPFGALDDFRDSGDERTWQREA